MFAAERDTVDNFASEVINNLGGTKEACENVYYQNARATGSNGHQERREGG